MLYYSVKVIFILKYVSRVVFKGGILGSARQFWDNPYLNSTTVLFDECCCFEDFFLVIEIEKNKVGYC